MKMDQPPKNQRSENSVTKEKAGNSVENQSTIDSLEKDFKSYEKKRYISSNNFKEKFRLFIKNNKFFNEFKTRLDDLLNESIDEMSIIEWNNEYTDESDKKIENLLNKKISSYLNEIFSLYENGSFSEKTKIISFLADFHLSAIFSNNPNTRNKISDFFTKKLETEKNDSGNYYIYLHLNALSKGAESFSNQVSPTQFIHEKFIHDERGGFENIGKGKQQLFISDPKNFQEIDQLNKSIDFKNKEDKKLNEKYEKFESLFIKPLTESYFRPNTNSKAYQDNFFDHNFFQYKSIRDEFKDKTGFVLEENSIPEQYNFFEYTKEITNKEANKFFSFLNKYGKNAFRTFLSVEQGGKEMGDKILALGEKLPEDTAKIVFAKYGEIIDTADNIQKILEEVLPREVVESAQKEIFEIKESLLVRAKDLLSTFYDKRDNNSEELLKNLERYKSEILLYADTYKKLKESGKEVKLEDIKNTEIIILSQEEKEKIANQLWDITIANRPFIKDEQEIEKRKKDFFSTIENRDSDFYIL